MTIVYRLIAAILIRTPHCEAVPTIARRLDHLRSWGSDAHFAARYRTGRNTHPVTRQPCVFYRHSS